MRYNATFDAVVKLLTNIFILATLALLGIQTFTKLNSTGGWISLGILLVSLLLTWGFHPQYYLVNDRTVIVQRPFGKIRIPLQSIVHTRPVIAEELGANRRRFGSGGLFGYLGYFYSSRIGRYSMWATNRESLVVIETDKKKYLLSPDRPVSFTNDINSRRYQH